MGTARAAAAGELPPRYESDLWDRRFLAELAPVLRPGVRILDLGSGARPTLAPSQRPEGCTYVGLDISAEELARAEPGSYDETVVGDAGRPVPSLVGRFDIALSWMALEHVASLEPVLENLRSYLRPGGHLIAQMPGRYSPFSIAGRVLSLRAARRLLERTQGRDPQSVFPARYDRCWYTALARLLAAGWEGWTVTPLFTAAGYVRFSRALTGAYILYEEWAYRRGHRNLAPYYLISARA